MYRKAKIMAIVGLVAALAVLAFAGSFCTDSESCDIGHVNPTSGYANSTIFTYTVDYVLSPGQEEAPDVYVDIFKGDTVGWSQMMTNTYVGSIMVKYSYQTTLPAGDYGFRFRTFDDMTLKFLGPTVSE